MDQRHLSGDDRQTGRNSTPGYQLACTAVVLLAVTLTTGCGGEQFGDVTGRVTLDGEPLVGATVEFQPEGGSPAYGVTDEQGRYKLLFSADQQGATVGIHRVRIMSFNEGRPQENERVPARYNRESELVREVKRGQQTIDFELSTK
jgi:hypothetical protein